MSAKKIRVGILFGGKSAEHEVSLASAQNVVSAIDTTKFEPVLIGISKSGRWHIGPGSLQQLASGRGAQATLLPGGKELISTKGGELQTLDVVFPVLHGPMGEDGTIQGFLELANLPYVGPNILGSAVGMDKDVMKRLLRGAGLHVTNFIVVREADLAELPPSKAVQQLGLPLFVKPANMGSSVGVSKVRTADELLPAIREALQFDVKALIETAVVGDEIECAVLGNDDPKASIVGRIIPKGDNFYSYQIKYVDEHGAALEIPANIPAKVAEAARRTAVKTCKILGCEGMSRVDMFAQKDGTIVVNEINTIPGFTKISMYPKLWEATGIGYTELITKLIDLAMQRYERRQKLRTTYQGHM